MSADWQPTATLDRLRLRAQLLVQIRAFFACRSVLEIETPVLSCAGVCDPYLHSLKTTLFSGLSQPTTLYLHTSPEFAMKRLLAAGSGSIYQIARVFREGEQGRLHNPEFTLIEWYRVGFDHHRLMEEIEILLRPMLGTAAFKQLSYAEAFQMHTGLNPHSTSVVALDHWARQAGLRFSGPACTHRDDYLDLILSHCIAPQLGWDQPVFIYDFPASQAALARTRKEHPPVAERFELFIHGMEIANGSHELTEPREQRCRFEAELAQRRQWGLPTVPMDERLLAALAQGLPNCAGVALGFDRLVMVLAGAGNITEVLAFPIERA